MLTQEEVAHAKAIRRLDLSPAYDRHGESFGEMSDYVTLHKNNWRDIQVLMSAILRESSEKFVWEHAIRQRDLLARAIVDAANDAGIIDDKMAKTGPELLLLCGNLGEAVKLAVGNSQQLLAALGAKADKDRKDLPGLLRFDLQEGTRLAHYVDGLDDARELVRTYLGVTEAPALPPETP